MIEHKRGRGERAAFWACLLGAIAACGWRAARAETIPPKIEAVLAAAKAASGGAAWDRLASWDEHGKLSAGGLTGTYESRLDYTAHRQRIDFVLGPDRGGQGWDGHAAWSTDASGQVRVETSREAEAAALQQIYLATNAFLLPRVWPAQFVDLGERNDGGQSYDVIKVTPPGADPVEIWFDRKTHLVAREVQLTGTQPQTFLLSDYVEQGGVRVASKTIARTGGNPKYDQVNTIERVEVNMPMPPSMFAPPPPPAYDAFFPAGRDAVTVPFRLINNHIYLDASIDGKPALPFVFDTGATNFFDRAHAERLGVKIEGAMPGGGFGNDISATGLARVGSVSIGGLTLKDQVFAAADEAAWINLEGAESAGLLGYEFAKRTAVTIDYAGRTITFTRPDAFKPPRATPIAFTFDAHIPMVQANVDGIGGEFEIDTGARSALTLMRPFADAHHLVEKYHATHTATTGYGVGGPSRALLARPGVLSIGPVSVPAPVADLVRDTAGAATASHTAGNIGGDILKRFTLTLDYAHQRLWLVPNPLAATPDVFDRSGVWITRAADHAIAIADISSDSAATKAGLHTGDEILAVNGRDASGIALFDLREAFKRKPGTRFTLSVRSGTAAPREIVLELADQV